MKDENTKNPKLILVYGLIMLVCVIIVVIIGLATGPKHIGGENSESQTLIDEKQNSFRSLEENVAALEKEVETLKLEKNQYISQVEELKKKAEGKTVPNSTEENKMLESLVEIYETFKSGDAETAKASFAEIDSADFDRATLAYYQILKDVLEEE